MAKVEFVTPEFKGFAAELTKTSGYKADKEEGEGAGKTKSSKAAAAPTPVGGTKNPKSNSAGPKPAGKGGAAHKADEDDAEGYD